MGKQKGVSILIGIIIIVAIASVATGGVFAYQYFFPKQTPIVQQNQNQNTQTAEQLLITSITPSSGKAGTAVTLSGTGFTSGSETYIGISESGQKGLTPTSISPTKIVFTIPSDLSVGVHSISVFVTAPQTPTSNIVKFTVISDDQTAGWKTYTNTQYGFEFKYPASLKFIDDSKYQTGKYLFYSHLNTTPTDGYGVPVFSFSILKESLNEYLTTLEQSSGWYEGVNSCENVSSVIDKTENIKLDGLDAKKITLNTCKNFGPISLPDKNGIQILTEKDDNLYIIGISPIIYDKYSGNYYKISDTFISTFKFTK